MQSRDPQAAQESGDRAALRGRWSIADLLDFEDVSQAERQLPSDERDRLASADRRRYLEAFQPALADKPEQSLAHRRATLLLWLKQRRAAIAIDDHPFPFSGQRFLSAQRLLSWAMWLLGLLAGALLASALLDYDGRQPINISWYLFVLVLLPLLMLLSAGLGWLLRRTPIIRGWISDIGLLGSAMRSLFAGLMGWFQLRLQTQWTSEPQAVLGAMAGRFQASRSLHGSIAAYPMLLPLQLFGIAFNLGVLMTTILLAWFSDLAFGWGSALDISPERVHAFAQVIAWPWHWWFGEGVGVPTPAQVAGTRIALKDPLFFQSAEDLRAWRWFLVLSVLTYGLLPRLLLLALTQWLQARALARLPLTHRTAQELYARMLTPRLEFGGVSQSGAEMPIPAPATSGQKSGAEATASQASVSPTASSPWMEPPLVCPREASQGASRIPADACLVLVHVDIAELLNQPECERLGQLLRSISGWRSLELLEIGGGQAKLEPTLARIRETNWQSPPGRLALVMDGSQPPITEHLRLLRALRAALGDQGQLLLALTGDPEGTDALPPLSEFEFTDWQRKIEQLGDPYLRLERLVPDAVKELQ